MKINIYLLVFGIICLIIIAAGLSVFLLNKSSSQSISLASLKDYGPAPNFQGTSGWVNSAPLNISQLKGKVVLVDFWTYSCINCIRTIPYLNAWESKYGNNGLVIVGVHTPEFQFEHNYSNVETAVQKFGIKYPVALDNNYSTWDAYGNEYWPADYLIDANGIIRYKSIGEGNYNQTEAAIRTLLVSAGYAIPSNITELNSTVNFSQIDTPEIYLGWDRAREPLGNKEGFSPNMTVNYTPTNLTYENAVYLLGSWYNSPDSMIAVNNSKIFLIYKARNVDIVADSINGTANITVMLDGKNLNQSYLGSDTHLVDGAAVANINGSRLYNIVSAPSYNGWHVLEINASRNFQIYTFTFG